VTRTPAPTSHDVARMAGVSQPTVSRALRGDPRLSPATRRRVQQAARDLDYVPSQRGRSLATRSTGQIGIVVSDLGNPFYLQVLDALHEALRHSDRRMLVLTSDADGRIPLDRLVDGSLDGVMLTSTPLHSTLPAELGRRGVPFVLLNREVDDAPGDVCVVDNAAGARLVAEELLHLGHRAIAAVFGPDYSSTGRDREASFRTVLDSAGVALPAQRWRRARYHFAEGHRCALELLHSEPTALWCANDILALGAYNAIHAQGLRIPQDITLIGFDDLTLASWEMFELTTVRQDIERMVRTATELLLSRIAHDSEVPLPPRRTVLPARLVRRRTHGPPPVATDGRPASSDPGSRRA
jgi:LacI family transcriptional regulator